MTMFSYVASHPNALSQAATSLRPLDMGDLSSLWILAREIRPSAILMAAVSP